MNAFDNFDSPRDLEEENKPANPFAIILDETSIIRWRQSGEPITEKWRWMSKTPDMFWTTIDVNGIAMTHKLRIETK